MRTFKWTVEIEISPHDVADGLDIGAEDVLYFALLRAFPYLHDCGNGMHVKTLKAPSLKSIAMAQGAYKRLGWVHDLVGAAHVLVSVNGADGAGSVRLLCGAKKQHGSLQTDLYDDDGVRLCLECKRRDES